MIQYDRDLYELIKGYIPQEYKTFYDMIKKEFRKSDGTVESIPNSVTITIRPAEAPDRLQNGTYIRHKRLVSFSIFTDIGGSEQIDEGNRIGKIIIDTMDSLINTNGIVDCIRVYETKHVGLSEQGLHAFSLEYKVIYN